MQQTKSNRDEANERTADDDAQQQPKHTSSFSAESGPFLPPGFSDMDGLLEPAFSSSSSAGGGGCTPSPRPRRSDSIITWRISQTRNTK